MEGNSFREVMQRYLDGSSTPDEEQSIRGKIRDWSNLEESNGKIWERIESHADGSSGDDDTEEQAWKLVEKALAGNASIEDMRVLRLLLARNNALDMQVTEFLDSYDDPDPQIPPEEKQRLLELLWQDGFARRGAGRIPEK